MTNTNRRISIQWIEEEADGTPNEMVTETADVNIAIEWLGSIERHIEKKKVADEIRAEDSEE